VEAVRQPGPGEGVLCPGAERPGRVPCGAAREAGRGMAKIARALLARLGVAVSGFGVSALVDAVRVAASVATTVGAVHVPTRPKHPAAPADLLAPAV
jgi:hypothetical protein